MEHATWQPKWFTTEHNSAWDRIKESMKRDWEQTKNDLGVKGTRDLNQGVGDTVQQAAGKEAIPPAAQPNTVDNRQGWADVELPMQYGFAGARHHAKQAWDDNVERDLRTEWEANQSKDAGSTAHRKWEDVKAMVRHGYERFINVSSL